MALTYNEYQALLVTLAWVGGFAPLWLGWAPRWRWWQCVGLALVLTPFIRMGVGVYYDLTALVQTTVSGGFVTLNPYSEAQLWTTAWRRVLYYLIVPAVGLILVWGGRVRRDSLDGAGLAPKASAAEDALHGLALFALIFVAYVGAMMIAYGLLAGVIPLTGDESRVWANITIPLILVLSGVAGLTEEFLFRGLMLRSFARVMPWGAAAVAQAVAFGLVHSGYMTWTHVLGPLAFGLGMAWVVRVLGIIPAMLLHAEVNVVFFAFDIADVNPDAWWLVAALLAANAYAAYRTRLRAVRALWSSVFGARAPEGGGPV